MLFNNVPNTCLVEESDFRLLSGRSGLNFNAHLINSLMKDCVTSLNDLCTASTKAQVEQMLINKIWKRSYINSHLIWRSSFQNMFTSCCNCYVTFLVANNTFSNNFKYLHSRKPGNSFGRMNIKSFYGNGTSYKVYYFPSKNCGKFEFLMIAR